MKKIILLFSFLVLFINTEIFAQKQKIEFDKKSKQIKVDGVSVGTIETLSGGGMFDVTSTYSIKDATNKEVILVKMYVEPTNKLVSTTELTFIESGQKAYPDADDRKSLSKDLVKNGVLTKEGFSKDGERKMLLLYAEKPNVANLNPFSNNNNNNQNNNTNNNTTLLERNRQSSVSVYGDNVQQDFKEIGRITKNEEMNSSGSILSVFKIFNHQNKQIAEATSEINGNILNLVTFKDNDRHTIKANGVLGSEAKKDLAEYLIQRYYW